MREIKVGRQDLAVNGENRQETVGYSAWEKRWWTDRGGRRADPVDDSVIDRRLAWARPFSSPSQWRRR